MVAVQMERKSPPAAPCPGRSGVHLPQVIEHRRSPGSGEWASWGL